jgi:guanylate kinase
VLLFAIGEGKMNERLAETWTDALQVICGKRGWRYDLTPFDMERLSMQRFFHNDHAVQCLIVSGPTGVGKSTILKALETSAKFSKFPNVFTRDPRPGERVGVDLIHMSETEFHEAEETGRFLQTNCRHGYCHGLLRQEFLDALQSGRIYLDKSALSTADLLTKLPSDSRAKILTVYVLPPDFSSLWERIVGRAQQIGTSKHENPEERVQTSICELRTFGDVYEVFIVNDTVSSATAKLLSLVS